MLRFIPALKKPLHPLVTQALGSFPDAIRGLHISARPARAAGPTLPPTPQDRTLSPLDASAPQLKTLSPSHEVLPEPAHESLQMSFRVPYRAGDGAAAILACLQPCIVIALDDAKPPGLRVLEPAAASPLPACAFTLPGMGGPRQDALAPEGLLALQALAQTEPAAFWSRLPQCMSQQGRELFAHFNAGLAVPDSADLCYRRLQAYANWLRNLAD